MLEERLNSQCTDRSSSKQWAEKLLGPPNFSVSFPLLIEEGLFQIWKELIPWEREHRKAQWRPDLEVVVSSKFPGRALKESHPCLELCSTSSACFELLLLCGTILRTTRSLLHSEQVLDTADLSLAPVVSVKKKTTSRLCDNIKRGLEKLGSSCSPSKHQTHPGRTLDRTCRTSQCPR